MATTIELTIEDDGSMSIETGEIESPAQEKAEGGQKLPVKSLDEALSAIKQLASSAMNQPEDENAGQPEGTDDQGQMSGMMEGFRPGTTGRGGM